MQAPHFFLLGFNLRQKMGRRSCWSFNLAVTPTTASITYQPRPHAEPARVGLFDDRYEPQGRSLPVSKLGCCGNSGSAMRLAVHCGEHTSRKHLALAAETCHARDRRRCRRGIDLRQTARDLRQGGDIHGALGRWLQRPLDGPAATAWALSRHVSTIGKGASPVDSACSSTTRARSMHEASKFGGQLRGRTCGCRQSHLEV